MRPAMAPCSITQMAFLRQPGRIQQFDAHQCLTGTARLQDPQAQLSDEKGLLHVDAHEALASKGSVKPSVSWPTMKWAFSSRSTRCALDSERARAARQPGGMHTATARTASLAATLNFVAEFPTNPTRSTARARRPLGGAHAQESKAALT